MMHPLVAQGFGPAVGANSFGLAGWLGSSFGLVDLDAGIAMAAVLSDIDVSNAEALGEQRGDLVTAVFETLG